MMLFIKAPSCCAMMLATLAVACHASNRAKHASNRAKHASNRAKRTLNGKGFFAKEFADEVWGKSDIFITKMLNMSDDQVYAYHITLQIKRDEEEIQEGVSYDLPTKVPVKTWSRQDLPNEDRYFYKKIKQTQKILRNVVKEHKKQNDKKKKPDEETTISFKELWTVVSSPETISKLDKADKENKEEDDFEGFWKKQQKLDPKWFGWLGKNKKCLDWLEIEFEVWDDITFGKRDNSDELPELSNHSILTELSNHSIIDGNVSFVQTGQSDNVPDLMEKYFKHLFDNAPKANDRRRLSSIHRLVAESKRFQH